MGVLLDAGGVPPRSSAFPCWGYRDCENSTLLCSAMGVVQQNLVMHQYSNRCTIQSGISIHLRETTSLIEFDVRFAPLLSVDLEYPHTPIFPQTWRNLAYWIMHWKNNLREAFYGTQTKNSLTIWITKMMTTKRREVPFQCVLRTILAAPMRWIRVVMRMTMILSSFERKPTLLYNYRLRGLAL